MKPIDFRSDTVTQPTAAMRRAMAEAPVGDDVYGEDPSVRALEERIAGELGHQAALFVPSGTQANQIAMGLHCRPGDEVVTEAGSHIFQYEGGAVAALWGIQPHPLQGHRGLLEPAQVAAALRPENIHFPRSRLLSLENTHNRGGGTVWRVPAFEAVVAPARQRGLAVHLDGARLFNAAVALGVPASRWASQVDTVSVCFSKGLGAPVGSALCGSRARIDEARRLRKRLGGGMRQAGILAAGALHALEHHVSRLAEDHAHARLLEEGLSRLPGVRVEAGETNIVVADFPVEVEESLARLKAHGVLANAAGVRPKALRFVTHLDVPREAVEESLRRLARALG